MPSRLANERGARHLAAARIVFLAAPALLVLHYACGTPSHAQEAPTAEAPAAAEAAPAPTATEPARAEEFAGYITERQKRLELSTDIDPAVKKSCADIFAQSLKDLARVEVWRKRGAELEAARLAAPQRLEQLKAELAQPAADLAADIPRDASLAELEQRLFKAEADLVAAQKLSAGVQARSNRSARRDEVVRLADAATKRIDEIQKNLAAPPAAPDDHVELTHARRIQLMVARLIDQSELASYEKELLTHDGVSADLLKLESDKAKRAESQAEKKVKLLRGIVNEKRRVETERQAEEARWAAANANPAVRRLAEQNQQLAEQHSQLAEKMQTLAVSLDETKNRLGEVTNAFKRVTEKAEMAGLTGAIGQLLRKQRAHLPDVRQFWQAKKSRQHEISTIQIDLFDLEDRRSDLSDIDVRAAELLREIGPGSNIVLEDIRKLLLTQRDYLDALISDSQAYTQKLINLDEAENKLVTETESYVNYIDQRVLWIRSTSPLEVAELRDAYGAAAWLASPQSWRDVGGLLIEDAREKPGVTIIAVFFFAPLFFLRKRIRGRLAEIGELAQRSHVTQIGPTIEATLLTALVASLYPALAWFVAWRLEAPIHVPEFAAALADGLQLTAVMYFSLEFFRQVCRIDGLAESHFHWPASATRLLRRHLRWLMICGLPLMLVVATMHYQSNETYNDSLGRIGFMVGLLLLATFNQRVLRPVGGALHPTVAFHRGGWVDRFSYFGYPLFVSAPIALAVLAGVGYYYTALRLASRVQLAVWLVMGLLLINAVFVRWLLVARRRLAIQQARQRRAAAAAEAKENPQGANTEAGPVIEEQGLDLSDIDVQSRRLLQSFVLLALVLGSGVIWVDVLPALGILNQIPLWNRGAADEITLANLALAILVAIMTVVGGRNLPGLMEIVLLRRLPLEPAVRYAITTVAKYTIVTAGVIATFSSMGVGWGKVQWLVAAVTFGLGFGLQEIFANFISGLIILFERPMRVGDTVTIGEVTGIVSKVRMRATTITDWDRKELIVPNKEFITGRLVNWTLSDPTLRVVVRVGVAYGSDTDQVRQVMLQVAAQNPMVLKDPAPNALFLGFGDSTLNFELRVFVPTIDNYLSVQHELNSSVNRAFAATGIELAFPQRTVHVRTVEGPTRAAPLSLAVADEPPGRDNRPLPGEPRMREAG